MFSDNPISIHAPREGSDVVCGPRPPSRLSFLSTLPARGATIKETKKQNIFTDFYPRSPRGERPRGSATLPWPVTFLSTLPARGATFERKELYHVPDISIHAPREGSDPDDRRIYVLRGGISIHAPREGSDDAGDVEGQPVFGFLSTLPARGATQHHHAAAGKTC